MRRTTKIILGIIGSIFIGSLLFIIGFSFSERRHDAYSNGPINEINIPQDKSIGIDIAPHRVVVLEEVNREAGFEEETKSGKIYISVNYYYSSKNSLTLSPIASGGGDKLIFPEKLDGCIVATTHNDTLTVQVKVDELQKKFKKKPEKELLFFSGINLTVCTSNVNIINKISNFQTVVANIETDSIKIHADGNILIESCNAFDIDPGLDGNLTVKNSMAKTINIDLDRRRSWKFEGCKIEYQNMTGSRKHNVTIHKNESGIINWSPKNSKAELNLKFQGNATQIHYSTPQSAFAPSDNARDTANQNPFALSAPM